MVDLFAWAWTVSAVQQFCILGLLLGYGLDAIRLFEELGTTVGPFDQKQEADMDKFGQGNACAKCGSDNAGFQFHEGMRANCELPEQTVDHMHRSCSQCGYEWAEVALDAS